MIASALPLSFILLSIIVLGATGNLFSASVVVIAAQVAAIALNVWARVSFQKGAFRVSAAPGGASLIRGGPYRFIRHPMYAAALLFVWTAVVSHISALTLAIGIAVTILCIVRINVEDKLLREAYPEYLEYARTTKALVPYVF